MTACLDSLTSIMLTSAAFSWTPLLRSTLPYNHNHCREIHHQFSTYSPGRTLHDTPQPQEKSSAGTLLVSWYPFPSFPVLMFLCLCLSRRLRASPSDWLDSEDPDDSSDTCLSTAVWFGSTPPRSSPLDFDLFIVLETRRVGVSIRYVVCEDVYIARGLLLIIFLF